MWIASGARDRGWRRDGGHAGAGGAHNHNVEAVILVVLVDPRFDVRFDLGDLCGLAFYDFGPHSRKLGVFIFFGCHRLPPFVNEDSAPMPCT
jgi:hypothetical protein